MSQVPVTLHYGKDALTDTWIEELRGQAERRGLVKVRFLEGGRGEKTTKDLAAEIATKSRLKLVDVRGFTATFQWH